MAEQRLLFLTGGNTLARRFMTAMSFHLQSILPVISSSHPTSPVYDRLLTLPYLYSSSLMRFAAYAGTSVVLAAGTVVRAFFQRSNFYSASVQISQSNACLMILTNVALLGVSMGMLGLQRLFYGPLRPIEVEQLYEKAWFAITETCLAMTIFREEVGGWFLVMFVSLLIGKVWGWIGEGRVEILEQQPPANPRLFHAQLSLSLLISYVFDIVMLRYSVDTVLRHERPNMMVMFAFEFAVLTVTSLSTAARYGISVYESSVIRKQVEQRRLMIRRQRAMARSQQTTTDPSANIPESDEDVDAMEIDAPGWEDKGRWIFYLDLTTDFFKLVLYITFFCVLCMFYGMPIHIIRDVALTIRSFYKRITDFLRYRQATRDMNARYPDATPEEVAREDVCIICREDIRPWPPQTNQDRQQEGNVNNNQAATNPTDERLRPKKLPCGHILHFACLRSWLERQQNCPTCRRPVLVPDTVARTQGPQILHLQGRPNPPPNGAQAQAPAPNPIRQQNVYQFGPLRIAFGERHGVPGPQQNNATGAANQQPTAPGAANAPRSRGLFSRQVAQPRTVTNLSSTAMSVQLQQIEQQLAREINDLRLQADQLQVVRALQAELARLRLIQSTTNTLSTPVVSHGLRPALTQSLQPTGVVYTAANPPQPGTSSNPHLPPGMTIPEGWTLLPLRQLSPNANAPAQENVQASTASSSANVAASTQPGHVVNPTGQPDLPSSTTEVPDTAEHANPAQSSGNDGTEPSIRSPAESTSASNQSHHQSLSADAQVSSLPQWGSSVLDSADRPADADSSSDIKPGKDVNVQEQVPSQGSATSSDEKGKGKATTVEDSTEDVD